MATKKNLSDKDSAGRRRRPHTWVILLLLVLLIGGALKLGGLPPFSRSGVYQAVFLNNGQVYFGKLSRYGDYPVLRDVYYLQITQNLQGGESQPSNVNLVKLGNELHGPMDRMQISRSSILFIEDLKPDSQVVKAIEKMKQNGQ
jgi:hypothetical protein